MLERISGVSLTVSWGRRELEEMADVISMEWNILKNHENQDIQPGHKEYRKKNIENT